VEYTPHDGDVTCTVFLKEERICYKMVYYTLYLYGILHFVF